jgi:tetratricopeptide (TPR) repeat protein
LAHYWGRRDYRRALDELEVARRYLPNDADLCAWVGYVQRRLGNGEKVFEAFRKATELNPRDANFLSNLGGSSYDCVHRYDDAVNAFDRALILAPDLYPAAMVRGLMYVRWQGRLDTLRVALGRIPNDAALGMGQLTRRCADLLFWERNADSLLLLLRNARVAVFDDQSSFLPTALWAAWANCMNGDRQAAGAAFESSLALLDSALNELPDDWRVHAARGLTLAGLGRREEALGEARWLQRSEVSRRVT